MREIKFRALKDDMSNCKFYYGCMVYDKSGNPRIYDVDTELFHTCIKGTEGQFIGVTDGNGEDIYTGDIDANTGFYVGWNQLHCCYGLFSVKDYFQKEILVDEYNNKGELLKPWQCLSIEVAGTIHEDKHLLK